MSNMVINTNILALNSHRALKNVGVTQARSSARLSSGLRINSAADDAAGLAISEKMRSQIKGLDIASRNAQDGISMVQTAEGGLQEVNNMVARIRELTSQAANGTNQSTDVEKIQGEIGQLVKEIDDTSNRLEFNGKTLLDGSLGTSIRSLIDYNSVSRTQVIDLAGLVLDAAGDELTFTAPEIAFINAVKGAPPTGWVATTPITEGMYRELQAIIAGTNAGGAPDLTGAQNAFARIEGVRVPGTGEDLGASTITDRRNQHIVLTVEEAAALGGGTVAGDALNFDMFSRLRDVVDGKIPTADMDTIQALYTFTLNQMTGGLKLNSAGQVLAKNGEELLIKDNLGDMHSLNVNEYLLYVQGNDLVSTGAGANSRFDITFDTIVGDSLMRRADYHEVEFNIVNEGGQPPFVFFQIGANSGQLVSTDFRAMSAKNVFDERLLHQFSQLSTLDSADISNMLNRISDSLEMVTTQRAEFGALQNRLEYTIKSLDISSENLSASESRIRDTDMAKEMMNLTKSNVLAQASISMLAQANQAPQAILQLLR